MNANKLVKDTERLHEIGRAMESMKSRYLRSAFNCSEYKQGNFPELAPKFQHRAEIQHLAYKRLESLFIKQLDEITSAI